MKKIVYIIILTLIGVFSFLFFSQPVKAQHMSGLLTIDKLQDLNNDGVLYLMNDNAYNYLNTQYIWYFMEYKTAVYGSNKVVLTVPDNLYIDLIFNNNVIERINNVSLIELTGNKLDFISDNQLIATITKGSINKAYYLKIKHKLTYNEGFNDGLNEAFNNNNLMSIAEKLGKGTAGPAIEFIGFRIPVNKKVKTITLLNLYGYKLKPIDFFKSGYKQGIYVNYETFGKLISFESKYDNFNEIIEIALDENEKVKNIDIVLAVDSQFPEVEVNKMLEHMSNNLGLYINNHILNDSAIDRFKEIIEFDLRKRLEIDYQNELNALLDYYLDKEFDKGYQKGLKDNPNNGFLAMLTTVFIGVGSILAIELLPNISIGSLILIPIVFGLIMFVLGKKGE